MEKLQKARKEVEKQKALVLDEMEERGKQGRLWTNGQVLPPCPRIPDAHGIPPSPSPHESGEEPGTMAEDPSRSAAGWAGDGSLAELEVEVNALPATLKT